MLINHLPRPLYHSLWECDDQRETKEKIFLIKDLFLCVLLTEMLNLCLLSHKNSTKPQLQSRDGLCVLLSMALHLNIHVYACACVCVCVHFQQKQYIITSEWLTYWLEILREIFPEASFIPKWECKQSNRKDSESTQPPTHTHKHTHSCCKRYHTCRVAGHLSSSLAWKKRRGKNRS